MPKFVVTLARDLWEKAEIDVEAEDEPAAEAAALAIAAANDGIEWGRQEAGQFDVIDITERYRAPAPNDE